MQKNSFLINTSFMSFVFLFNLFCTTEYPVSTFLMLDKFSILMIFMSFSVLMVTNLLMLKNNYSKNMMILLLLLGLNFFFIFLVQNMMIFYMLFEISVIPLMFLVSSWGYSLDRIKAMMFMFIYTFIFSLPFFFSLFYLMEFNEINLFQTSFSTKSYSSLIILTMLLLFLVKVPMWTMHLWLMKAHVEASNEGSMILASVVLKLAGIGLIKYSTFLNMEFQQIFMSFLICLGVWGSIVLCFLLVKQTDLKMMVAISSIVHMSFMYLCYFYMNYFSFSTMLLLMVSHGLVSPLMFMYVSIMYNYNSSRSLHIVKGLIKLNFCLSMLWFILCSMNMSVPISMNFFGELMFFISSLKFNKIIFFTSMILIFLNGMFNMYMYSIKSSGKTQMNFFSVKPLYKTIMYCYIMFLSTYCLMMIFH